MPRTRRPLRGLIVFDGDNYHASAREAGIKLRKRHLVEMLEQAATRQRRKIIFTTKVVFMSRSGLEGQSELNRLGAQGIQRDTGILYRIYDIINGHGHEDNMILRYLKRHRRSYDVLVMVTSDADYFDTLEQLGAQGKQVVLLCFKDHTSRWRLRQLRHVRYAWVNNLLTREVPDSLFS
jgi:hypothetical protein